MNLGLKIGLGVLAVGSVGVAGAYIWMGNTSTLDTLLEVIPDDTLGVVAIQGIPDVLQDYHVLNGDFSPAFLTAEEWERMQGMMDVKVDPQDFLTQGKLNPLGISAMTVNADLSTEIPKSICGAYYLPSLSPQDSALFFKTFIEEQLNGMPLSIEESDGVYSIMQVAWKAHSDWVVFSYCEDGDSTAYLKGLGSSKKGYSKVAAGELLNEMSSGDWQLVGSVNLEPLHSKFDALTELDPSFESLKEFIEITDYQSLGMKGYLGTGSATFDLGLRVSSSDAKALQYLSEIETTKMIDRLVGEPILVLQQGINFQHQLDAMLKMEPLVQEQYDAAKQEFQSATGMDLENDFVKKLGNQVGMALVHDDFVAGAEIWLELESGHKFAELATKALEEMGGMLNKEEKDGSLFLQTPPSMSDMIGIPNLSVTIGITQSELVIAAGKSTPNNIKKLGDGSISSNLDGGLKSKIKDARYGSVVVDFVSAKKLLEDEMLKTIVEDALNDQEQKLLQTVASSLKSFSVTSSLQDRTVTTSMALEGTSGTAFSDIIKNDLIPELKKSF